MQKFAALEPTLATDQVGIATHCPYCALQCGMYLNGSREKATTHALAANTR